MRDNNAHFLKTNSVVICQSCLSDVIYIFKCRNTIPVDFLRWDVHLLSHLCRIRQYLYGWLKTLFWCHFYSSSLKFYLSRSKSSEPPKNKFLPVIKVLISFNIRLSQVKSNMNFNINVLSFIYALSTSVWKKKQQQFSVVTGLETLFFFMHNCVRLASLIS